MKNALDLFLAAVVALCMGVLIYGFVRYPDAPIQPCESNQFCGKGNRLHTEEQYRGFLAWEQTLLISFPFGLAAGFVLHRRSRRRSALAWDRQRALQADLSPTIEGRRYAAAWKDLRKRRWAAHLLFLPALLWMAWAIFLVSFPEGGFFAPLPLPLALFALLSGSLLWYLFFRCPRCGNRYFLIQASTVWGNSKRCVHCGLRREATFEQALAELKKPDGAIMAGPMVSVSEIEEEVFRRLRSLTPRGTQISRDQRVIQDLKLASDDATAMAIALERKYKIKIPRKEWGQVATVQDTVDLLARHLRKPE